MTEGKVILITGASRGIGRALAAAASAEGHRIVLNDRSEGGETNAFAAHLSSIGGRSIAIRADVTVQSDNEQMIARTIDEFGGLDCVINNAGVGTVVSLTDLNEGTFEQTLRSNLVSAFLVSQAAWPKMTDRGGRLIFLSSGAARSGGRLSAASAASKAGLEGLMHYYAAALRPHYITANAVAPSLIETEMMRGMDLSHTERHPLGRPGRAEELWPLVRMIIETEYLTGQTIHIDAGRYMT